MTSTTARPGELTGRIVRRRDADRAAVTLHMALILCAQTFMYVSARSVGDDEYKRGACVTAGGGG